MKKRKPYGVKSKLAFGSTPKKTTKSKAIARAYKGYKKK